MAHLYMTQLNQSSEHLALALSQRVLVVIGISALNLTIRHSKVNLTVPRRGRDALLQVIEADPMQTARRHLAAQIAISHVMIIKHLHRVSKINKP